MTEKFSLIIIDFNYDVLDLSFQEILESANIFLFFLKIIQQVAY